MNKKEEKLQERINKLEDSLGKFEYKEKPESKKKTPTFFTGEVVVLIIITIIVSLLMGSIVTYKLILEKQNDKELQEFISTYNDVINNYYKQVDKKELIDAAVNGMMETLDKNSVFIDSNTSDTFNKQLEGSYEGYGMEIYNNDKGEIVVAAVYKNTSAAKEGIKAGDVITKLFDKDLKDTKTSKFVKDANKHDKIEITYKRDNKINTVTLEKQEVILSSVSSRMIEDKIGYIRVTMFAENTDEQFAERLNNLEEKGLNGLIVDLRSNTGGYLYTAEQMVSLFLDSSHNIYQIKIKDKITKHKSTGKEDKDYKIVILVDRVSASAAEVFTSALKEQYGAIVVGEKTYGKGTVQELQSLPNGDQYKFTTKEWLTSKGKSIDGKGIKPDIEIRLNDSYYTDPSDKTDNQLQEALKEVKKN